MDKAWEPVQRISHPLGGPLRVLTGKHRITASGWHSSTRLLAMKSCTKTATIYSQQYQVNILKVKSHSHFFWCCIILLLKSHLFWVWKVADNTDITNISRVGFLLPIYISQSLLRLCRLPLPPLESWRNTARRVDVRIRLWQHESFIKIPVMLSSLAGALRPYFSESNFRFRHKYVLLVYHKLSVHCCFSKAAFCLSCTPQLSSPSCVHFYSLLAHI